MTANTPVLEFFQCPCIVCGEQPDFARRVRLEIGEMGVAEVSALLTPLCWEHSQISKQTILDLIAFGENENEHSIEN